jgi:hypothetical protein
MIISPRKGPDIPKQPLPIALAEPAEPSLIPTHWPEALKLIVLLAALWAITLGVFIISFVLEWIIGS